MHQLRSELPLMMEEKQTSMMHAMREMMTEFMRNNGRSESGSAEGSAVVGGSRRWAEPTAARETSAAAAAAAAAAGGGARGDTTAGRETTLHKEASRNFGVTGRRGVAVPVEVGPIRGQPDQQRRAGEWDTYPGGESGRGHDLPLSRHTAFKHTPVPLFSGQKPAFTAWTRDARYYAKGVRFLSAFVSDPPQYIPGGELDAENSVLVKRGYSRESVHKHALARNFLSTVLKSKSAKSILHRCTSPREA